MKAYNYRWVVKIKKGLFMAGAHRFRLKKDAVEFVEQWKRTPGNSCTYADLPQVKKGGATL